MRFRVLGCSGGQVPGHNLSSYVINDRLLIDAGSIATTLDVKAQCKIQNILLTHVHLDHVMGLASLAENLFGKTRVTVKAWAIPDVISAIKATFFNNSLWPDFTNITSPEQPVPVLTFEPIQEGVPITIADVSLTTVRVNHIVPSTAFFIQNKNRTLLHVGDTGPTEKVWETAETRTDMCAIVLEASFPNRLQRLADLSKHLTPQGLEAELGKLNRPLIPVLVAHMKPQYRDEIIKEIKAIKGYQLRILEDGDVVEF
jgi:ribonuclease BN (tRNA processing enzyme)